MACKECAYQSQQRHRAECEARMAIGLRYHLKIMIELATISSVKGEGRCWCQFGECTDGYNCQIRERELASAKSMLAEAGG